MPFTRPPLDELRRTTRRQLATRLGAPDPTLGNTNLRVIADVFAGLIAGNHAHLDWVAREAVPDTATETLPRWAALWNIERRPATRAAGTVDLTGTNGAVLAAGAILVGGGQRFRVLDGATIAGGAGQVAVQAVAPGAAGNLEPDVPLTREVAGVGIATLTVSADGFAGGADVESDTALRARLLDRLTQPPAGGAAHDYRAWALTVPGVSRVWIDPEGMGLGTVVVRFAMDGIRSDGIPLAADLAAVEAAIEPLRPVTAHLFVVAPVPVPLDVTVADLTPDTPAVRGAIQAALADMLLIRAVPGQVLSRSWISEAIAIAAGEDRHTLVSPAADIVLGAGDLAVPGTLTVV